MVIIGILANKADIPICVVRSHAETVERRVMAKVISICNQKGGCGKSTLTENLGAALADCGARVLLVDLDPSGNLSIALGLPKNSRNTIESLMRSVILEDTLEFEETVVHHEEGMDILPANRLLTGMELQLQTLEDSKTVLRDVLSAIQSRYEFILIDCMPSLGMLTLNALTASDEVLIPVQPQCLSVEGLQELMGTIAKVRKTSNRSLKIGGIVFSLDSNVRSNERRIKEDVRAAYGYMPKDVKNLVDEVVDKLERNPKVAELYDLWYRQKCAIIATYTSNFPSKEPLSENEAFRPIKNAVMETANEMPLVMMAEGTRVLKCEKQVQSDHQMLEETLARIEREHQVTEETQEVSCEEHKPSFRSIESFLYRVSKVFEDKRPVGDQGQVMDKKMYIHQEERKLELGIR